MPVYGPKPRPGSPTTPADWLTAGVSPDQPLHHTPYEVFAKAFASGKDYAESAVEAYPQYRERSHAKQAGWGIELKNKPAIRRRIEYLWGIIEQVEQEEMAQFAIAQKVRRIEGLEERRARLLRVIEERGSEPEMQDVPGGATGMLVRTTKMIGIGNAAKEVEEYAVDTQTLAELRQIEKHAAIELGQWSEKSEFTGKDGSPLGPATINVNINPVKAKES